MNARRAIERVGPWPGLRMALITPLAATAQAPTDRWTFSLQPYLWLPSVEAQLKYGPPPAGGSGANVSIETEDTAAAKLDPTTKHVQARNS